MDRVWQMGIFSLTVLGGSVSQAGEEHSGGETTVFVTGREAFSRPLANISRHALRLHAVGDSFFNANWVIAPASTAGRDGLGPLFNARSCSACHLRDGRGRPPESGDVLQSMLLRLSHPGVGEQGQPLASPIYGGQLQNHSIPGVLPEGYARIRYRPSEGIYADESSYSLRFPTYGLSQLKYGKADPQLQIGPRVAQAVHGLGLLEAVPEADIVSREDPDDTDGDGISGRANRVWNRIEGAATLGRFGWKANQPDLRQQTEAAFHGDIGITTPNFPAENLTAHQSHCLGPLPDSPSPEANQKVIDRVVAYLQTLAPPARRHWDKPEVRAGEQHFRDLGCAKCHVEELRTGPAHQVAFPELANQVIRPYTDLLLHDLGDGLADNRPDFLANGREWRTPPLWGIGLQEAVNGHLFLLHDGRARGFAEAILWHHGEAESSSQGFRKLSGIQRAELIAFLRSL